MKYTSLYKGYDFIHEENLLDTLLINRGVENPKRLLNLNSNEVFDGKLLKNMDKGLELLYNHIINNKIIHIIIDSDNDGYTSAAEIFLYIKDINPNIRITYSFHTGKQHGIVLDELKEFKFDLLIIPDAGTNDIKQSKILTNKGIDILILDHHDIEENNDYAIVINCKDNCYPNSTLAGAGVVYKFCKEFDKKYKYNFADKYLDLVALGCIGDIVDLRNYETRYLVEKGLKNFGKYNELLCEIVKKQKYSLKDQVTIKGIGWYISPLINAVSRVGTQEEKEKLFKALIGEQQIVEYQPKRKHKDDPKPDIELHSLQQTVARECVNIKSRQDTMVRKSVEIIKQRIADKKLTDNKLLIVDCTDILENTFTGLVANKLAEQYKRPVILLRKKEVNNELYGGSCRNYNLFPIISFKDFLTELNTFNNLGGHSNAFGFEIHKDKLVDTNQKANEILKNVKIEDVYKVDYEIPIGRLKTQHIKQVGEWSNIWGNSLDEPLFAVTDIYINTEKIKLIGSKKNIIKFDINNITFICKNADEELYNKIILKQSKGLKKRIERVKLDIVGKFIINKWEENEYPQIEIVDFNSIEDNEILF